MRSVSPYLYNIVVPHIDHCIAWPCPHIHGLLSFFHDYISFSVAMQPRLIILDLCIAQWWYMSARHLSPDLSFIFMVYWLCWIQVKFSTYNLGPQYLVHTLKMDGTYSYYLCICHLNLIVVSLNLDLYFSKTKYSHGRFKGKARPRSVSTL